MSIVQNPTAGDVHVNVPLTNFSQKWLQDSDMFVGLNAMPNLPVSKQSDVYYEFSREDFFRNNAKRRADGTESQGVGFGLSTDQYYADVYALHKDVTDRQRANQDSVISLDRSTSEFVAQQLMIGRELLFQQTFMPAAAGSGTWDTEVTGAAAPGAGDVVFWDGGVSDPIIDIRTAIRAVHQRTGLRPNKFLLGRQAWDALADNDAILARVTGGATRNLPAMVMRELVAQLFEIDQIYVMDAVVNTAEQGETENTGFISGDNALIYYAPDGLSPDTPSAGAQFSWTGFMGATNNGMRIKRFRSEKTESDRIEGQMAFDYKVTSSELGYYFHNVVSA